MATSRPGRRWPITKCDCKNERHAPAKSTGSGSNRRAFTKIWNMPQLRKRRSRLLGFGQRRIEQRKSSRFYKRLVYDDQIATDANAFVSLAEIGGQFRVQATARPGQDLRQVEKELDEELARFLKDGPTAEELARVSRNTKRILFVALSELADLAASLTGWRRARFI